MKVEFKDDSTGELKAAWEHAKRTLRSAAKGGNKDAKWALGRIERAEASKTVFTFGVNNGLGGYGQTNGTTMGINLSRIQSVDNNETNTSAVMLHEFGHAFYNASPKIYNADTSDLTALNFENAYRGFLDFPIRTTHGPYPNGFWHP